MPGATSSQPRYRGKVPALCVTYNVPDRSILNRQPTLDHRQHVFDLLVRKRPPRGNIVPLGQTAAAAGGGGVLGDEHRMAPHGRLTAVARGLGRCQTLGDEFTPMIENHGQRFLMQIGPFFGTQAKSPAELAPCQGRKLPLPRGRTVR